MAIQFLNDQYISGTLQVVGAVTFDTAVNPGSDTDKFMVLNGSVVGFRTGAEILADIAAVTGVTGSQPIISSEGVTPAISLNYTGANNVIEKATDLEGTAIVSLDSIIYNDAGDGNVKKGLISDLPFTSTLGTVTSITPGADSGSGTAITTSGTLTVAGGTNITTSVSGTTITVDADFSQYGWTLQGDSGSSTIPSGATVDIQGGTGITTALTGSAPYTMDLSIDSSVIPSGSGTSGKLAKWTGTSTLGDSIVTETTGLITVAGALSANSGTTNTVATFTSTDAGANITLTDTSNRSTIEQNTADLFISSDPDGSTASSTIKFQVDGSTKVTILDSGNVGIGTTDPDTYRLRVNGGTSNVPVLVESTDNKVYIGFKDSDTTTAPLIGGDDEDLIFNTNDTLALTIDTSQDATFTGAGTFEGILKVSYLNPVFDLQQSGATKFRIELDGGNDTYMTSYGTGNKIFLRTDNITALTLDGSQDATFAGNITLEATKTLKYADDKIKIGGTSNTPGAQGIQIGYAADSSGAQGIGVGYAANATGDQSLAMGYNPTASGTYSQAFGYNVTASGSGTVVFGTSGSHSDVDTFVLSGLVLKSTGTGTSSFLGAVSITDMATITYSDISSGENRGLRIINTSGTDQQWNITTGITGSENESFCIRDATADVNVLTLAISSGNAVFSGNISNTSGQIIPNELSMGDSKKILLGNGDDAEIQHTGSHLFFDNAVGSTYIRNAGVLSSSIIIRNSDTGDIQFDNEYAGNILFNTSNVQRMSVNSAGTVCIGPDALDIQFSPASTSGGKNIIYLRGNAADDKSEISLNHYGHANMFIGMGTTANTVMSLTATSGGTDGIIIDTSGNVGIGVSAPDALLTMTDTGYVQEWDRAKGFYQYTTQTGSAAGDFDVSTVINTNNLRGLAVDYYESGHYYNNGANTYFRHSRIYIMIESSTLRIGDVELIKSSGNVPGAIVAAPTVTASGTHEATIVSTILSGYTHYLSVDIVGSGFSSFESIS